MKRLWPEEDDMFMLCLGVAVLLAFCIGLLIGME